MAPTAEPRLHDAREWQVRRPHFGGDVDRARLPQAGSGKQGRRPQLVVRHEQPLRAIQHVHAALLERREHVEARLDPIERGQHVEPEERDVARLECRESERRRQHGGFDAARQPGADEQVGHPGGTADHGNPCDGPPG